MATIGIIKIGMSVATGGLSKGLQSAQQSLRAFGGGVQTSVSSAIGAFGQIGLAVMGAKAAISGLTAVIGTPLQLAASAEQTAVSLKVLLGSADAAQSMMKDLNKFAASTPFQFPEIAQSAKQLVAFGVPAKDIITTLTNIGNAASGSEIPLKELAEIFGKIKVQNKVMAEDMNQMSGRGINLTKELAKQFGVAEDSVRDLVSSGKVNFTHIEKAFASMSAEGGMFENLMLEQSRTLGGVWSTLQDTIGQALTEIGTAIVDTFDLKGAITGVSGLVDLAMPYVRQFLAGVKQSFEFVKSVFAELQPIITQTQNIITTSFTVVWNVIQELGGVFQSVFGGMISTVTSFLPSWTTVRNAVLDGMIAMEFAITNWKRVAEFSFKTVLLGAVTFGNTITHVFTRVIPTVMIWLANNWRDILSTMASFATTIFTNLSMNIVNVLRNLPGLIRGQVNFNDLWTPLTEGAIVTLKSLPQIPERQMGAFEAAMKADLQKMGLNMAADFVNMRDKRLKELLPPEAKKEITAVTDAGKKAAPTAPTAPQASQKVELASAARLGTEEARKAILQHRFGKSTTDPIKKVESNTKELVDVNKETAKDIKKIAAKEQPAILRF